MTAFKATSAAKAFLLASDFVIKHGTKGSGIIEILNGVVEFKNFEHGEFEDQFDAEFRRVFGDDRIDYCSEYTFSEPELVDGKYQFRLVEDGWKNSYLGRMIAWEEEHNQIENVIRRLKKRENIKQCEIVVFHPTYDMRKMFKMPCLLSIDFKPRNGELNMTATFRSQRLSKSGYGDYTALINLGKFIARECGLVLKNVTVIAHSLHVYRDDELKKTKEMLELFSNKPTVEKSEVKCA